ncbi:MAG: T9SS type A sorting domain-containing protein, partial [Bacteroidetes bacterium]|nr:T9SS type A sorting domain-containing protein [Bacteroidota bacterium]
LTPQPVDPADHTLQVDTSLVFHWNGSLCAPRYRLQYSTDSLFLTDTITINNIFGTSLPVSGLTHDTTYYWHIMALLQDTIFYTDWSSIMQFTTRKPDGLEELDNTAALSMSVEPNPTHGYSNLVLNIPVAGKVNVLLYDLTGRKQQTMITEYLSKGTYIRNLNFNDIAPGIYILTLQLTQYSHELRYTTKLSIIF